MSVDTLIEIIPNKQLALIASDPKLVEVLDQVACAPNLYGFYKLDPEEYMEVIEGLDEHYVNKLAQLLQDAEAQLPTDIYAHGFRSTYFLHESALPKALHEQNINKAEEAAEKLLNGSSHFLSPEINILTHNDIIVLSDMLSEVDPAAFLPFYQWQDHEPIEVWKQEVQDEMTTLIDSIHYAASHDASLLYIYC